MLGGLLAAVAPLVLAAACSSSGTTAPPTSTAGGPSTSSPAVAPTTSAPAAPSTAPPTTPAAVDDEAAVLAAYQGFWQAVLETSNPPTPGSASLQMTATDEALSIAERNIASRQRAGVVVRLPAGSIYRHAATVESLSGTDAVVRDCATDDSQVIQASSGAVINSDVETNLWRSHLVLANGRWRVSRNELIQRSPGATACDG